MYIAGVVDGSGYVRGGVPVAGVGDTNYVE